MAGYQFTYHPDPLPTGGTDVSGQTMDVRMPDGTVIQNVPSNITKAELQRRYQASLPKPTSFLQGVAEGVHHMASRAGQAMEHIDPTLMLSEKLGLMPTQAQQDQRANRMFAASPYRGSKAGNLVGSIAMGVPLMAIPGGPVVQGALQGALAGDATTPGGIAREAAIGGALGKAGEIGGNALGALVGGKNISPAARALVNEGITLTPGQLAGKRSLSQFVEDKILGTVPALDAIPAAAASRAENGLRVATANRVLAPIGESVPRNMPINSDTIGALQNKVYDNLSDAAGNLSLQLDPQLAMDLHGIVQASPRLIGADGAKQVASNVAHIGQMTAGQPVTGQTLRDMLNEIRGTASSADGQLRNQLWGVHDAVVDALGRQNSGEALDAFNNARESAALMKRMESAASKSVNGEFGPTQLLQAARQRGYGTTTGNVASGGARLLDLANNAAEVMRNKTANSGTAGRTIAGSLLLGGPTAFLAHANPLMGAVVGAKLLGYVPGVAEILQNMAVNRPEVLQQVGRGIEAASPTIGRLTAATVPSLFSQ